MAWPAPFRRSLDRLTGTLCSIVLAGSLMFLLVHWIPGDPTRAMLGEMAPPEDVARLSHELGLDRPLGLRYLDFWQGVLTGRLGRSLENGEPVSARIGPAFGRTFLLALAALSLAWPLGLAGGIVAAAGRHRRWGRWITGLALVGTAVPAIVIGPLLMDFLAVRWALLPVSGAGGGRHLVLPALTIALAMAPHLIRITQAVVEDELDKPYILLAQAKGLRPWVVVFRHALPGTVPILGTVSGVQWGNLLTGAIVVETLFSWPGMGFLLTRAIGCRDYPMILGITVLFTTIYQGIGWLVDATTDGWQRRRYPRLGAGDGPG
ncbi:MAG TPA: ABC transporter permease [Candidatus Aminicenantes bacterium]|nr:ABC transporter permease [Candidatus Aminicenantes bacterium]